jgi:hypothetical protein
MLKRFPLVSTNELSQARQLLRTDVAVEKVQFSPEQPKFGGYKMPRKFRKSFVGHPGAILFLRISAEGVFQQPQTIALKFRLLSIHFTAGMAQLEAGIRRTETAQLEAETRKAERPN